VRRAVLKSGAGRMAAWTGCRSACLRAKGLGRPRSYLNGRVEESWTADGVGDRETGEGATDTDLHGRAPTGTWKGKADLAKRLTSGASAPGANWCTWRKYSRRQARARAWAAGLRVEVFMTPR